ncbi:hypothetical protein JCM3774_003709 [Rhodotorula dairenensis]
MRFAVSLVAWASLAALSMAAPSQATHTRVAKEPKPVLASSNNPDDPTGTPLYVTEPACGFFRCTVTWPVGAQVAVNWINPIEGNVSVSLQSNIGGPTYMIAPSIPAISQEGYCDSGAGVGVVQPGHECGMVQFVVPEAWERMDNYTIVVMSLADSNTIGYTDSITIANANSSSSAREIPTGTVASVLTIPAPTSTDLGASTPYYGSLPKPTAVTRAVSSSASSASATAASGSESRAASSASGSDSSAASAAATSSAQPSSASGAAAAAATSATSSSSRIGASWLCTLSATLAGGLAHVLTA